MNIEMYNKLVADGGYCVYINRALCEIVEMLGIDDDDDVIVVDCKNKKYKYNKDLDDEKFMQKLVCDLNYKNNTLYIYLSNRNYI